ncbi:hypothetical protein [Veillonella sp.]|uniref:hypothetical protein n=1 Tax=Veillonella sp. TaxID=1926307 RepID=UPI0025D2608F|nr:hypothetical protein [Veillonella sp.]
MDPHKVVGVDELTGYRVGTVMRVSKPPFIVYDEPGARAAGLIGVAVLCIAGLVYV